MRCAHPSGIYSNKAVQIIWKIDSVFDVHYMEGNLSKTLIEGRDTDDYDNKLRAIIEDADKEIGFKIAQSNRFFCGVPFETNYRKISHGGMQGARLVNLKDVIEDFADAQDAAQKLATHTWT